MKHTGLIIVLSVVFQGCALFPTPQTPSTASVPAITEQPVALSITGDAAFPGVIKHPILNESQIESELSSIVESLDRESVDMVSNDH